MLSQRWNYFLVCSASDEMRSAYVQPAMKFVQCMKSIIWMMFLKWVVISSYAEHAQNLLLVGWACVKIGYSLAEHEWKLVTLWLSIPENWLLVGWAYAEICFYWHSPCFFPCHPFPCPLSRPLSNVLCLLSHFSVLCFPPFATILCSMSHFFVPCLPSSVPCLTSLFLISCPLFHVSLLCSLFPALCSLSHFSVPYIWSSVPCLTSLFLVSCPLFPILSLCSLSPALFPKS